METHYEFIRNIRKQRKAKEPIDLADQLDYCWALHRIFEHKSSLAKKLTIKQSYTLRAASFFQKAMSLEEELYGHPEGALKRYVDHPIIRSK